MTPADPEAPHTSAPPPLRSRLWLRSLLKCLASLIIGILFFGIALWCTLAIYYAGLHGSPPRIILALAFVFALILVLWLVRPRHRRFMVLALMFAAVLVWFFLLQPSNNLHWAPDVAQTAAIDFNHDIITIHNMRNFTYRSESDFTPVWLDQTYDLSKLRTVDFSLCYWGSKAIAHAIVSFGFEGDRYLAVSIEARRERSESYSAIQSFFRQFELVYIFADERDVLRLRTNYRHENVLLYRTNLSPEQAKGLLLSYIKRANALERTPEFYNGLTSNCATNVLKLVQENWSASLSWKVLLSGYAARVAYRNGRLDTRIPFAVLETQSNIDAAAIAADQDPSFSTRIRAALPDPFPAPLPKAGM